MKRVKLLEPLRLNKEQLEIVKNIQSSLYNDLLNLHAKIDFEHFFYGIFIVFLTKTPNVQLNWDLMNAFNFENFYVYDKLNDTEFIEQAIQNEIIVKFKQNKNRLFTIKEIDEKIRASDTFPNICDDNKQMTYAQFFEEKYGLKTIDINQPLAELAQYHLNLNFLLKSSNFKKERPEKKRKFKELFLLEHIFFLPFTKNQTNTLIMCPAVIHRLDCLFRASKLKNQIEMHIVKDLNITNVSEEYRFIFFYMKTKHFF